MSKAEIVNVGDEPYADDDDQINEEESKKEEIKPEIEPKSVESNENSQYKASSTIVPLDDKDSDDKGFVQICSGTVGFNEPEPPKAEETKENKDQNEVQKSACCLII